MNWRNVKLLFLREARDQMRDRRTLFTIAVLPLLLYPLLGMSFLQVAQFLREHASKVLVLSAGEMPESPPLLEENRFAAELLNQHDRELLHVVAAPAEQVPALADVPEFARKLLLEGEFDVVVYLPAGMSNRVSGGGEEAPAAENSRPLDPQIFHNTAKDKSRVAFGRVDRVLGNWRSDIVRRNLAASRVPPSVTEPFAVRETDVAEAQGRAAAIWSKVLPFVVLIWALTGAFYPAVDLCAGEKERGTLETLLTSPADRSEIVWGKLLTVMTFSAATAILNLASMGISGWFIISHMKDMGAPGLQLGPPPLAACGWLLVALLPITALFSALSLAVAAFARSSKEGQYYLMPLLLISLPLMLLPLALSTQLDLGMSLIPVTGMMLLLRALIEGQYAEALRFAAPVLGVTLLCCLLAIRWATEQFRNESVLFREGERWGLGIWLRHLVRDREDTPNVAEAMLCGVLLLVIRFFVGFLTGMPTDWNSFVITTAITLIALIATPALLMTIMLTRSPRKTLLLRWPRPATLPAAVLLAMLLHPAAMALARGISHLYPYSPEVIEQLSKFDSILAGSPHFGWILLLMALLPAVCEELAFRGFILSGLRHMGHKWGAIALTSLFFGVAHGVLQQSLTACAMGVVIGYLAIHTGSLLPCILFHSTFNAMSLVLGTYAKGWLAANSAWQWLFHLTADGSYAYNWYVPIAGFLAGVLVLAWIRRLPYKPYAEENLRELLSRQTLQSVA